MIALLLLLCAVHSLQVGPHVFEHRSQIGCGLHQPYNVTANVFFLEYTSCNFIVDVLNQVNFRNNLVVVQSIDDCQDSTAAKYIVDYSNRKVKGIIFWEAQGKSLPYPQAIGDCPSDELIVPVPVVSITYDTYASVFRLTDKNHLYEQVTLSKVGDVDFHTSTASPAASGDDNSDHKDIWWWVSATTLQDWLFLLFGFLCVILMLLIGLKFYRICKIRVNNSVVIRNLRVARIERIPIVQYNKSITNDSCVICLEEFDNTCAVKVLSCNHGYHPHCIDVWLMQSDKCPLCNDDAMRKKKRCWDSCCLFCYPNRDDFGFQRMSDDEEPVRDNMEEVEMNLANVEPIEVVDTYHMLEDPRGLIN